MKKSITVIKKGIKRNVRWSAIASLRKLAFVFGGDLFVFCVLFCLLNTPSKRVALEG